jgi:hypothetical protein
VTGRALRGVVLYAVPLLLFLVVPNLAEGMLAQVLRGMGCVLVTSTVIAGLQRAVPSTAGARVFGLSHVLVLVGTCVGAVMAPLILGAVGLDITLVLASMMPVVGALVLVPALLRFDRDGAASLAALDPTVDVLRRLALFADANRATLYEVADRIAEVEEPAGVDVVRQGDVADDLFVLVSGTVRVTIEGPQGPRVVRQMTGPTYFGEIGVLHEVNRTATVTTEGPCRLWRVPGDAFLWAAGQAGLSNALTDNVRVRMGAQAPYLAAPLASGS